MNIVTGGAGFIGSHLVEKLVNDNYTNNVCVLDNFSRGRMEFLDKIPKRKFGVVSLDIKSIYNILDIPNDCSILYHLASNADVRGGYDNNTIDVDVNINGTWKVLRFMRKHDIPKIVYTSSATVYGEMGKVELDENMCDFQPISLHGASKLATEKMLVAFCKTYGIKYNIFRFNNVVGERNTHGVIPDFVDKLMKNNKELEILGNGLQTKQYLHVSDCVDGIIELSKNDNQIYNIAHTSSMQVKDLATIVIDELGYQNVERTYTDSDRGWIGDVPYTTLLVDKAMKCGWKPKIPIDQAIRRTVRWLYEDKLSNTNKNT